jgi:membrane protein DedA with SNARE-associated domain
MSLEELILRYGYLALFVGTFLEGETILIVAGFMAQRGYLDLHWAIAAAFLGSFSGDQLFFYLGRGQGMAFLERRTAWQAKAERAFALLHRYQTAIILGFRFVYGIRNVTPFAIGASGIAPARFFVLNFVGALVWAIAFGTAGFQLGAAMESMLEELEKYELAILAAVVATILAFLLWTRREEKGVAERRRHRADRRRQRKKGRAHGRKRREYR